MIKTRLNATPLGVLILGLVLCLPVVALAQDDTFDFWLSQAYVERLASENRAAPGGRGKRRAVFHARVALEPDDLREHGKDETGAGSLRRSPPQPAIRRSPARSPRGSG